jgi:hypothetical protein
LTIGAAPATVRAVIRASGDTSAEREITIPGTAFDQPRRERARQRGVGEMRVPGAQDAVRPRLVT